MVTSSVTLNKNIYDNEGIEIVIKINNDSLNLYTYEGEVIAFRLITKNCNFAYMLENRFNVKLGKYIEDIKKYCMTIDHITGMNTVVYKSYDKFLITLNAAYTIFWG